MRVPKGGQNWWWGTRGEVDIKRSKALALVLRGLERLLAKKSARSNDSPCFVHDTMVSCGMVCDATGPLHQHNMVGNMRHTHTPLQMRPNEVGCCIASLLPSLEAIVQDPKMTFNV